MCDFPTLIHIHHRVIHAVHIQIPALHHRGDLRNVCVGLYAQSVLALVCFLRIVSVDAVCVRPVGVLLCETAYGGGTQGKVLIFHLVHPFGHHRILIFVSSSAFRKHASFRSTSSSKYAYSLFFNNSILCDNICILSRHLRSRSFSSVL